MRKRCGSAGGIFILGLACLLAAGQASAAESKDRTFAAGLSYDHFSRTVFWDSDEVSSKILSNMISAQADFGLGKGVVFSLSAGLSFSNFKDVIFASLPISLRFEGAPLKGLSLGAELVAPFARLGDIEISAAGRFVFSFGMPKTWSLEGFAVEGVAQGKQNWMEASAGPRFSYPFFGRVIPYVELSARWLRADFRMEETLADLSGEEKKRVDGDFGFGVALGAEAKISGHLIVKVKAAIMPFAGGGNGWASVGLLYTY